jgi:hypothetical protein
MTPHCLQSQGSLQRAALHFARGAPADTAAWRAACVTPGKGCLPASGAGGRWGMRCRGGGAEMPFVFPIRADLRGVVTS